MLQNTLLYLHPGPERCTAFRLSTFARFLYLHNCCLYLHLHGFPPSLLIRIFKPQEHVLLKDLPPQLRRDIAILQFQQLAPTLCDNKKIASPLLSLLKPLLQREILAHLTLVVFDKGESVFRHGEYAVSSTGQATVCEQTRPCAFVL